MITSILNYFHKREHGYSSRAYLRNLWRKHQLIQRQAFLVKFDPSIMMAVVMTKRLDFVLTSYLEGDSLETIALNLPDQFGFGTVTRERIRQMLMKAERLLKEKTK